MNKFGLIGEKLSHSLSPDIHETIFNLTDFSGQYKLYEYDKNKVKNALIELKEMGLKGVNITIPYKETFLEALDFISEEARKIGAINTVAFKEDGLHGYNTDYFGFGEMLKRKQVEIKDKVVVILGTGGAAKAVYHYVLDNYPSKLYIVTRDVESIKGSFKKAIVLDYKALEDINGDILINTTPVGMYPKGEFSPVDRNIVKNFKVVADVVYNPLKTKLLNMAEEENKETVDGLYMLIAQAIKAEEIWRDVAIEESVGEELYNKFKKILE